MRTLPTLGVAAATLLALSALEWVAGGVALAQQLGPPARIEALEADASGGQNLLQEEPLNLLQKEPLFGGSSEGFVGGLGGFSPATSGRPTSDSPSSRWQTSEPVSWLSSPPASDCDYWRSLLMLHPVSLHPGRACARPVGDYWKPGEFERLVGSR